MDSQRLRGTEAPRRRGGEGIAARGGSRRFRGIVVLLLLVPLLAAGCGTYELRGRAVTGPVSGVFVVDKDDPRLEEPGLAGTVVSLTLDPERLSANHVGQHTSDVNGWFAIPVHEFGAGVLEHDALLEARLAGHALASQRFQLPRRGKRVLVMLAPGDGEPRPEREHILDETRRWAEPYMQ